MQSTTGKAKIQDGDKNISNAIIIFLFICITKIINLTGKRGLNNTSTGQDAITWFAKRYWEINVIF